MSLLPEQMDPMDSFLLMVLLISIASGMPHPDTIEFSLKGAFKFVYGWIYSASQALCQNAAKANPSLGNMMILQPNANKTVIEAPKA